MLSLETRPYCRIRCLEDVGFLCTHVERVDESREYRRILEPRQISGMKSRIARAIDNASLHVAKTS